MHVHLIYTVQDPYGDDMKLNSFKTIVGLKLMIILQNLITTDHRKSGKSKHDRKLAELDVVSTRIRCQVSAKGRTGKIIGVFLITICTNVNL